MYNGLSAPFISYINYSWTSFQLLQQQYFAECLHRLSSWPAVLVVLPNRFKQLPRPRLQLSRTRMRHFVTMNSRLTLDSFRSSPGFIYLRPCPTSPVISRLWHRLGHPGCRCPYSPCLESVSKIAVISQVRSANFWAGRRAASPASHSGLFDSIWRIDQSIFLIGLYFKFQFELCIDNFKIKNPI